MRASRLVSRCFVRALAVLALWFIVPAPVEAQQMDNPEYFSPSMTGELFIPSMPYGGSPYSYMSVSITDQSGALVSVNCTNTQVGSTKQAVIAFPKLYPNKDYTVTLRVQVLGSSPLMAQGTAVFAAPQGFTMLINGVAASRKSSSFIPAGQNNFTTFTIRLGVANDYVNDQIQVDLPGGRPTSIISDKPIWYVGLGRMRNGDSAGGVGFRQPDFFNANFFTPAVLYYESLDQTEVDRVPDAGTLRQVRSREVVVDIPTPPGGSNTYTINVYLASAVPTSGAPDAQGVWPLTGNPICSYTVSQVNTVADGNGVKITRVEDDATFETSLQLKQNTDGATWTHRDWRRSGVEDLDPNCVRTVYPSALAATVSHSGASAGALGDPEATETPLTWTKTFGSYPWGKELTQVASGGGQPNPLVTTYDFHYFTEPDAYRGFLKSKINPDGSWVRYGYYTTSTASGAAGMVKRIYRPWLNGPATPAQATTSNSVYEDWTYAMAEDQSYTLPAAHVVYAPGGTVLARTEWTYALSAGTLNARAISQWVRKDYSSSGTNDFVSTVTRFYPRDLGERYYRGKPVSTQYPDGRKDSYLYLDGTWDKDARSFNEISGGDARAVLCFHGQTSGGVAVSAWGAAGLQIEPLQMVANRSTISETIIDTYGRVVREAEYVFVAPNTREATRNFCYEFDTIKGRPTGSIDLIRSVGAALFATSTAYANALPGIVTDADGTQTSYEYDDLLRLTKVTEDYIPANVSGFASLPARIKETRYDGAGRPVEKYSCGCGTGPLMLGYDPAGRLDWQSEKSPNPSDPDLITDYNNGTLRTLTVGLPSGATQTQEFYLDGRLKVVGGTAAAPATFNYAINSTGILATRWNGSDTSNGWLEEQRDWLGRVVKTSEPAWGWTPGNNNIVDRYSDFNAVGQLWRQRTIYRATGARLVADTISAYDGAGRLLRRGLDVDGDGLLGDGGWDRFAANDSYFEKDSWGWRVVSTVHAFETAGSAAATRLSTVINRVTGFYGGTLDGEGGFVTSDVVTVDANYQWKVQEEHVLPSARRRKFQECASTGGGWAYEDTVNGYRTLAVSVAGVQAGYTYDDLGRLKTQTKGSGSGSPVATTYTYHGNTDFVDTVSADGVVTDYAYQWNGDGTRMVTAIDSANGVTYTRYNAMDLPDRVWGSAAEPVQYGYDAFGRRTSLTTWRQTGTADTAWPVNPGDTTSWVIDPATGLLKEKVYANTRKTTFTYKPSGAVATRTWARNTSTAYEYSTGAAGTGELLSVDYGDSTTDLAFTYHRTGRLDQVTDTAGNRTFAWRADLQVQAESLPAFYGSKTFTPSYDASVTGRPTGFSFNGAETVSSTYGYDGSGRLGSVRGDLGTASRTFFFDYALGANWVNQVRDGTLSGQTITHGSFARAIQPTSTRGLIQNVVTTWNGAERARFGAQYTDPRGWRSVQDSGGTSTAPVESWSKKLGLGDGVRSTFTYDARGRIDTAPAPAWLGATGSMPLADRTSDWNFDYAGNRSGSNTESNAAIGYDLTENTVNKAYGSLNQYSKTTVGSTDTTMVYDDDGNLTSDGTWSYTYDAENRLSAMSRSGQSLTFAYDYAGRRIRKTVTGTAASDTKFLWHGWRLAAELAADGATPKRTFISGPDFSNSQGAAGGAGALLGQFTKTGGVTEFHYALADVSGNMAGYLDGSGNMAAAREFSAFGRVINSWFGSGKSAADFPVGFSGQYTDAETGLVYYGLRYYNPTHGRFVNRDPIGEAGGENVYGFVGNSPTNSWDVLGLSCIVLPALTDSDGRPVGPDIVWCTPDLGSLPQRGQNPVWWQPASAATLGLIRKDLREGFDDMERLVPAANTADTGQAGGLSQEQIYQLLKDRIEFDPEPPGKGGNRDAAFEEKVLRDLARLIATKTESGVQELILASIAKGPTKVTVAYGKGLSTRAGRRALSLSSVPGQDYMDKASREDLMEHGELATGENAGLIVLAHELGHALADQLEYGAVVFFENEFRRALGVGEDRTKHHGEELGDPARDIEKFNEFREAYGGNSP